MKKQKRKSKIFNQILSFMVVLALVFGMMPVTALAAADYSAYAPTRVENYYRGANGIFANGTAITIEEAPNGTRVWYMDGSTRKYVTKNGENGEDLSDWDIFAGSTNADGMRGVNGSVTMTGGSVGGIYAGQLSGYFRGTSYITVTGGRVQSIHCNSRLAASSLVDYITTVTIFDATGTVILTEEGNADNVVQKNGSTWRVSGEGIIPAGVTLTVAEGETLTIPHGSTLINQGTIINRGTITINGILENKGTFREEGKTVRNVAYVTTTEEETPSVWLNGSLVPSPVMEYVEGKWYIYGLLGNLKVTINRTDYYGISRENTATQLQKEYLGVTDFSGLPEQIKANEIMTLEAAPVPAATTLTQTLSYQLVDDGGTGAVLEGSSLTAYSSGAVKIRVKASDNYFTYEKDYSLPVTFTPVTGVSPALPVQLHPGTHTLPEAFPSDASYREIQWTVVDAGDTGATVSGRQLTILREGTLKLRCQVENGAAYGTAYTGEYTVAVKALDYIDISQGSVTIGKKDDNTVTVTYPGFHGGKKDYPSEEPIAITGTATNQHTVTVESGKVSLLLQDCHISYEDGKVAQPICIKAGATVNLKLTGENSLTHTGSVAGEAVENSALRVLEGASLTIEGEGSLTATAGAGSAAIGGGQKKTSGTITINGGKISAQGGSSSAGIGSGYEGTSGSITINDGVISAKGGGTGAGIGSGYRGIGGSIIIHGGEITATGGVSSGAGIGGGQYSSGGEITIYGGEMIAQGGSGGAGIGGGWYGGAGSITIYGGTIVAGSSDSWSGAGIGSGLSGSGGSVTINGGNIKASSGDGQAIGAGRNGSGVTVQNGEGQNISLGIFTLQGALADTPVTEVEGLTYGLKDVQTLDTDKLYFYLPQEAAFTSITAGETRYRCTSDHCTYYPDHDWSGNDGICVRCEENCTHQEEDGSCQICGIQLHIHNWTYVREGENLLIATCEKEHCPETDGGYVMLSVPHSLTYTGSTLEAVVDNQLTTGDDVQVVYSETPINVGEYTAGITVKGETIQVTYTITAADLKEAKVTVSSNEIYDGTKKEPTDITVTLEDKILEKDRDYTISYDNNLAAGTASVVITGTGNYQGRAEGSFPIQPAELSEVQVAQEGILTYAGGRTLTPEVATWATTLQGEAVNFAYSREETGPYGEMPSFEEAGTYTVYYQATAANHREATGSFTVEVEKAAVPEPVIPAKPYNGSLQRAEVPESSLYTVEQNAEGTERGSYEVVLKLTDLKNYRWSTTDTPEVTLSFVISGEENEWITLPQILGWVYGKQENTPAYEAKYGTVKVTYTGTANDGSDYQGEAVPVRAGNYTAAFTVEGTEEYTGLSYQVDFTIEKATPVLVTIEGTAITEGEALEKSVLTGVAHHSREQEVAVEGTFSWKEGAMVPQVSDSGVTEYGVIFAPGDSYNYHTAEGTVTLTVMPKDPSQGEDNENPEEEEPGVYAVSFENTGETVYETLKIKEKDLIPQPSEPKKTGFFFGGWYQDKAYEKPWDFESDTVSGNTTLYGSWYLEAGEGEMAVLEVEDQLYTGSAIKPKVVVKDGDRILVEGQDYTLSYKNHKAVNAVKVKENGIEQNFDPKLPTITIKGKGAYTKKISLNFNIVARDITQPEITLALEKTYAYTGKNLKIENLTYQKKKLKAKKDYTISYYPAEVYVQVEKDVARLEAEFASHKTEKVKACGEYVAVIRGTGNFTGMIVKEFGIYQKTSLQKAKLVLTASAKNKAYTGQEIILEDSEITMKVKGRNLTLAELNKEDSGFEVVYDNNTAVGKATITVRAKKDNAEYAGSKSASFTIQGTPVKKVSLEGFENQYSYTGKEITQTKLTLLSPEGEALQRGIHYQLIYEKNITAGKAVVKIQGLPEGGYTGILKKTFAIVKKDLNEVTDLTGEVQVVYSKTPAKPQPVLSHDGVELVYGRDYKVSWKFSSKAADRNDAKAPAMVIQGIKNYTGTKTIPYSILPQEITAAQISITVSDVKKGSDPSKAKITVKDGNQKMVEGKDYRIEYSKMTEEGSSEEVSCFILTGEGNYQGSTKPQKIHSYQISITKAKFFKLEDGVEKEIGNVFYTGTAHRPQLIVKYDRNQDGILEILQPYDEVTGMGDYLVTGYGENVKTGTKNGSISVKGMGDFGNTKVLKFSILPKWLKWFLGQS